MTPHLGKIVIAEDATIRAAMEAIDCGAVEIALVIDRDQKLLGTLTDGDVRRAILSGAPLDAPATAYMNRQFTAVNTAASRVEVLDLLKARSLRHIPVLDESGRLAGLHLLQEIVGGAPLPNWAVVMAGGRGERLRPITDLVPKPMVKVAGRPILERLVLHLVGAGIRRVFISVNYLGDVIERHFADGATFGCRIEYLREDRPLGTGGALATLPTLPVDPLLVVNGDLLTQFDAAKMLAYHAQGQFKATIGVHQYVHTVPYGVVDTQDSSVLQVREKPSKAWLVNAGIYALEPGLIERVPRDTEFSMPALIDECIRRDERVGAFRIEADWIDVGQHRELQRAQNGRVEL